MKCEEEELGFGSCNPVMDVKASDLWSKVASVQHFCAVNNNNRGAASRNYQLCLIIYSPSKSCSQILVAEI